MAKSKGERLAAFDWLTHEILASDWLFGTLKGFAKPSSRNIPYSCSNVYLIFSIMEELVDLELLQRYMRWRNEQQIT